jgi:membrane associated rhomboid family serine protease
VPCQPRSHGGLAAGQTVAVVIPIHDDNPTRRTPVVTYLLIILNFVFFFTEPVVSHIGVGSESVAQVCQQQSYFDRYAAIPKELTTDKTLPPHTYVIQTNQGAVRCPPINESGKKPYLSVLFAMFLHGGWLHILGNMLFLWIFGNNVEDTFGRLRFLLFYLFCGYVATYGFAFGNPDSTTTLVGASGAIAGVLGAYLVLFPRARVTSLIPIAIILIPVRLPAWVVLGGWFLLQWLYSSGSGVASGAGVAYLAHVFGFVAGLAIALLAKPMLARSSRPLPNAWY